MKKRTARYHVFGREVLLIGTQHKTIDQHSDEYDPRETELYTLLDSFDPGLVYVEMEDKMQFRDRHTTKQDIDALLAYAEDTPTEFRQYDTPMEKKFLEYHIERTEQQSQKLQQSDNYRATLYDIQPEMFEDVFTSREQEAIETFLETLENGPQRIVIQFGNRHYSAYTSFFELLSDPV